MSRSTIGPSTRAGRILWALALAGLAAACGDEPAAAVEDAPAATSTGNAAAASVGDDLLAAVGFGGDAGARWVSNNEASRFLAQDGTNPARARLVEKSQIHWQIPLGDSREGDAFRLSVKARKVEVAPLRLRLQVTWLPQGGWSVQGTEGNHIRNDIRVVDVDSFGWETHTFDVIQAPHALDVVIYLVNAGPREVEVADITFERLGPGAGDR